MLLRKPLGEECHGCLQTCVRWLCDRPCPVWVGKGREDMSVTQRVASARVWLGSSVCAYMCLVGGAVRLRPRCVVCVRRALPPGLPGRVRKHILSPVGGLRGGSSCVLLHVHRSWPWAPAEAALYPKLTPVCSSSCLSVPGWPGAPPLEAPSSRQTVGSQLRLPLSPLLCRLTWPCGCP